MAAKGCIKECPSYNTCFVRPVEVDEKRVPFRYYERSMNGNRDKTILYMTDNALDDWLMKRCQELLLKASDGLPIISVSQKPIEFGRNICVGDIGRSGLSIDTQLYEGLKETNTTWVAIAEHDCIYSKEHFQWTPPDKNYFYYNDNVWLVQLNNPKYPEWNGMYSYKRLRRVQSQLICSTQLLKNATEKKLAILSDPAWLERHARGRIGEPGAACFARAMKVSRYKDVRHLQAALKEYTTIYGARDFVTKIPNIDIRHENNFTGPRRGNKRRFELKPWGRLEDILNA
jgi:hypothetical protein